MADIEIADLGAIGEVSDLPAHELPANAWETVINARYENNAVVRTTGQQQVFGTPGVAPYFTLPVAGNGQVWWLYMSLTKGYVYDGNSHTDITRTVGGDYNANSAADFNGTVLGGIPILNTGNDDPQFWASYAGATKLADLTNWPANTLCKVLRAYGPHLVAFNVTKSGTNSPHMVKWSHPAVVGALPSTWDETDQTKDAGEVELEDSRAGAIQDALGLGANFFIYKEGSVWIMRFVGGRQIFRFDRFLENTGILTGRCVTNTLQSTYQIFATGDDVLLHNGTGVDSIANRRVRHQIFNSINTSAIDQCFMLDNPLEKEVLFCYPESSQTTATAAWVWSYEDGLPGKWSQREINFVAGAIGEAEVASDASSWEDLGTTTWEELQFTWGSSTGSRIVVCDPTNTKFYLLDESYTFDGTSYDTTILRSGLALIGQKPDRTPLVDFKRWKTVTRMWIRAEGAPFRVRLGSQITVEGSVTWGTYKTFDPSVDMYVDQIVNGRAMAIEFTNLTDDPFTIHGYKLELFPEGTF